MLRSSFSFSSLPLALSSTQGLDKKPWVSMLLWCCLSLLPDERLFWSNEPVLLLFFTSKGARVPGLSRDVSERLFNVSDKCSLLRVWRKPSPLALVPTSLSEGSTESHRAHSWLVLPPVQLLWLLWYPLLAWRLKVVLRLFSKGKSWSPIAGPWRFNGWLWRGHRSGIGRFKSWGGETMKLSPSSWAVCRLTSELPVAREESLWDGCCTKESRSKRLTLLQKMNKTN